MIHALNKPPGDGIACNIVSTSGGHFNKLNLSIKKQNLALHLCVNLGQQSLYHASRYYDLGVIHRKSESFL